MAVPRIDRAETILHFLARRVGDRPPLLVTLATCADEVACARMVVLRGFDDAAGTCWVSSDGRAAKVAHLRKRPLAEIAAWFPEEGIQLRLRVRWTIVDAAASRASARLRKLRAEAWRSHSAASRRLFPRPASGQASDAPGPHFALLVGRVKRMDALHISPRRQRRYLHERTARSWRSRTIAP